MSLVVALRINSPRCINSVAIVGIADIVRGTATPGSDVNDPSETLAVHYTNGFPPLSKLLSQRIQCSLLNLGCRYAATRVHHAARQLYRRLAARPARAAAGDAG